ncbi:MAG: MFS transporter [Candidatus Korobacteraceae bacterium]|jgi:sugar phosphate permease
MPSVETRDALEVATMRQVTLRLVPFLMLSYFVCWLDRVNAGFAALQMNKAVGLTYAAFGIGGGLFYVSYVCCEIPSNLVLEKVGARIWIARIMVTWGLISGCMAFVSGPYSFYFLRFLLGAAEAGFFPGVILYLTYWFPAEYRGRIVALFMVAIPVSSFIGSPISASLLSLRGFGLQGWQWLFIAEAIPAIFMGLLVLVVLPNRPAEAKWLTAEQREWLIGRLDSWQRKPKPVGHMPLWKVLTNKYVLTLAIVNCANSALSNALSLWQPQIIKSFGLSNMQTGLLNSIPFGLASVLMLLWGRRSDRSGERVWNTSLPMALCAVSLGATLLTRSLAITMVLLTLTLIGNCLVKGPLWAVSTEWLSKTAAAAGIAQINTIAHIANFGATSLLGIIKGATGSYPLALLPLTTLAAVASISIVLISRKLPKDVVAAAAATD